MLLGLEEVEQVAANGKPRLKRAIRPTEPSGQPGTVSTVGG
jgi:hypothetical protein